MNPKWLDLEYWDIVEQAAIWEDQREAWRRWYKQEVKKLAFKRRHRLNGRASSED